MRLHEGSKENGINKGIKRFIESDEAKVEILIFVINLLRVLLRILILIFILKKNIKELFYLILILYMQHVVIIKFLKFELFYIMQKFYMKLEKIHQIFK